MGELGWSEEFGVKARKTVSGEYISLGPRSQTGPIYYQFVDVLSVKANTILYTRLGQVLRLVLPQANILSFQAGYRNL